LEFIGYTRRNIYIRKESMTTKIEWVQNPDGTKGETWNPITGCSKISTGCRNCYAERIAKRLAGHYGYPEQPHHFDVTLHPDKYNQPEHWKKPRMIFVCSMGDLFHENIPAEYIINIFEMMAFCKQHTFQVLTKRPKRMFDVLYGKEGNYFLGGGDYFDNIWLGVTAENQEAADERIPWLLKMPAAVKFVSVEPMLEAIDIRQYLSQWHFIGTRAKPFRLDWVICGGETGHGAREMKAEWAMDLLEQCKDADVPFFFKKAGDAFNETRSSFTLREILMKTREYPTT
jgi:protein gp37